MQERGQELRIRHKFPPSIAQRFWSKTQWRRPNAVQVNLAGPEA